MASSFFLILCLFFCASVQAQQPTLQERAESVSATVQRQIGAAADFLDVLLAGKRYTSQVNNTHVNVSQLVTYGEGGSVNTSTDFGLNLRLLNVEKRWALRFSSYDENAEERDLNQSTVRTTSRPRDLGTALMLFKKLGNVRTSFQPRIQFSSPLQMNYTLRFETDADAKKFSVHPKLEFYADSQKGTGEFFSLVLAYKPGGRWQYSITNQEEYRQNANDFTTDHGVGAGYTISDTQSLSWAAIASSENHNYHLNSINLSNSYSQQIFARILRYSLSPYISFAKTNGFKGLTGISFVLDATF